MIGGNINMSYDVNLRNKLLNKIDGLGGIRYNKVFVSLDEFFQGNNDISSIGCNLMEHPGIDIFYKTLKVLSNNSKVEKVLVQIMDVDDGYWPFSERVYIITSLDIDHLKDQLKILQFDDLYIDEEEVSQIEVPVGYRKIAVWWD